MKGEDKEGYNKEIEELKLVIEELKLEIEELKVKKDVVSVSIIFKKYKKSILVKNKYSNKNTTKECKELMKGLGGRWLRTEEEIGWLFVGRYEEGKTLEENSKFIIKELEDSKYDLEICME